MKRTLSSHHQLPFVYVDIYPRESICARLFLALSSINRGWFVNVHKAESLLRIFWRARGSLVQFALKNYAIQKVAARNIHPARGRTDNNRPVQILWSGQKRPLLITDSLGHKLSEHPYVDRASNESPVIRGYPLMLNDIVLSTSLHEHGCGLEALQSSAAADSKVHVFNAPSGLVHVSNMARVSDEIVWMGRRMLYTALLYGASVNERLGIIIGGLVISGMFSSHSQETLSTTVTRSALGQFAGISREIAGRTINLKTGTCPGFIRLMFGDSNGNPYQENHGGGKILVNKRQVIELVTSDPRFGLIAANTAVLHRMLKET